MHFNSTMASHREEDHGILEFSRHEVKVEVIENHLESGVGNTLKCNLFRHFTDLKIIVF